MTILLQSCVTSNITIDESHKNWENKNTRSVDDIYHSIYLIGDVGGAEADTTTIPLIELKKHLVIDNRKDENTDVVFLGDNIYPVGMPPVGHDDRADAEHKLNVQLEAVREFGGNITFVPGNHDWYRYGREGLIRQENYIEEYLAQYNEKFTDFFRPSNGCGNVDVMQISNDIALVSIDSHWFLAEKDEEGYDYTDCEIQNRQQFVEAFADTMKLLADKKVMLTMHHPLYTTGKHGGNYSLQTILMPTTAYNKYLIIPAPITGLVVAYMRTRVSEQDINHKEYTNYRNYIIPPLQEHGHAVVAAGHEHNLQYHIVDGIDYIVSGSGSKRGPLKLEDFSKFIYGNYGYAIVDYYKDGTTWLSFYALTEDDSDFEKVFTSQIDTDDK